MVLVLVDKLGIEYARIEATAETAAILNETAQDVTEGDLWWEVAQEKTT